MQITDKLYRAFLEEMNALENFRITYTGLHRSPPLEQEDPEIKRLTEALAFFIARTRLSTEKNILATRRRIFEQFFSFLLAPLPSMAILQAELTSRFVDPTMLPRGSEVAIDSENGKGAIFRTVYDLPLYPLTFQKMETLLLPGQGQRILLHFRTPFPFGEPLERLSIFINHLNNYTTSLQVFYNLQKYLRKVSVFFDEKVTEESRGGNCSFNFGAPLERDEMAHQDVTHPLQKIREFFYFPSSELYLNLKVPPAQKSWTRLVLAFDLDARWPKSLRLNQDIFQFFTVPIINLKRSLAEPILFDGTQERHALRYADPSVKFNLHSVLGVFRLKEEGMVPLRPGILVGGNGSYEVEEEESSNGKHNWLLLNLPQAFGDPQGIATEALWYQPWFSDHLVSLLKASLYDRMIQGSRWNLLGDVKAHRENPLKIDFEGLLQILSLQKKSSLQLEDVQVLLKGLGSLENSPFQVIPTLIQKLKVLQTSIEIKGQKKIKHIYHFLLQEFDASYISLVETFFKKLVQILNIWNSEVVSTIEVEVANTQNILNFE